MKRKALILSAALLFWLLCQLSPVYRVRIGGESPTLCLSPAAFREGLACAGDTAAELLGPEAALPAFSRSLRLGLRPARQDAAVLSDALLRAAEGIDAADCVRVNGETLGAVRNGAALLEALRALIREGLPEGAAVGNLGGTLELSPVYTRAGTEIAEADMLRTVTALAPVFYLDAEGRALAG